MMLFTKTANKKNLLAWEEQSPNLNSNKSLKLTNHPPETIVLQRAKFLYFGEFLLDSQCFSLNATKS